MGPRFYHLMHMKGFKVTLMYQLKSLQNIIFDRRVFIGLLDLEGSYSKTIVKKMK